MRIHSYNEWDTLKEIIVGSATNANWPTNDPVYAKEKHKTKWTETPVPAGPVPQYVVDETNEDLEGLCEILRQANVSVHRPSTMDFPALGGMYNYCPRDRLLIAGETIVDTAMMYPCRDMEIQALDYVVRGSRVKHMPRQEGLVCDAANILRMNDKWIFLESPSGNLEAYNWMVEQFPQIAIERVNFYTGVHIDSSILALNDGTALVNASRITTETLPASIKNWDIIWIEDVVAQDFYQYPYASKWIGLNVLSIDTKTVIVDAAQKEIITILESKGFTVIPHTLRHSRTLGGGFHCVTLDTWRENA